MTKIERRGLCLVLSAPSGAGKTAIAQALLASEPDLQPSVSMTTRVPRSGERDGVDYHFVSEADFAEAERTGQLLEWARVLQGTHAYGTPRRPVEAALAAGSDIIFDIDWQGHRSLLKAVPNDVVGVFILPPSLGVLEQRLRGRAGDDANEIARRMQVAHDEISHWQDFAHVVVNDELQDAIAAVRAILHAGRLVAQRQTGLSAFVTALSTNPKDGAAG
jgi:guanylate kinase